MSSILNAFNVALEYLQIPPVVELGSATVGVPHQLLAHLQITPIGEKIRPTGRAKRVAAKAHSGADPCIAESPLHHLPGVDAAHAVGREHLAPPLRAPKQKAVFVLGDARLIYIYVEILGELMVDRDFDLDAALAVDADLGPSPLRDVVAHPEIDNRADARKGERHHPDEGPVAQPHQIGGIETLQKRCHIVHLEGGRLAYAAPHFFGRHLARRVIDQHALFHEVGEHLAQRRGVLLDRSLGQLPIGILAFGA